MYLWAVFLQVLDKSWYGEYIHHKQETGWWFIHSMQRSEKNQGIKKILNVFIMLEAIS